MKNALHSFVKKSFFWTHFFKSFFHDLFKSFSETFFQAKNPVRFVYRVEHDVDKAIL